MWPPFVCSAVPPTFTLLPSALLPFFYKVNCDSLSIQSLLAPHTFPYVYHLSLPVILQPRINLLNHPPPPPNINQP